MKLKEYISTFPSGAKRSAELEKIANHLCISKSYLRGIISGSHPFPEWIALPLDDITNGEVPAHESCPKLYPKPYNWR